jgi:aryl-alcohol dehydrogenase-like predicted oxidoreductase
MERKRFGRTGMSVSRLVMGTMSFGGDADEAESGRLYAAARDAGINLFDCANVYVDGRSEEILGRLVKGHRDEVILTTKVGTGTGNSPRAIRQGIEASLKRLGTDRVEVFFLHKFDDQTPIEESLRALELLRREGKILHAAVSNYAAWQVMKAQAVAEKRGTRIDILQPMYSLVKRQAEVEILPMALSEGIAVAPYSPLGGGLLTGKYADGGQGRILDDPSYATRYGPSWMHETARALSRHAATLGQSPATLAVAWAAKHPGVTAPIIGARSVAQLAPSLAAGTFELDEGLKARIDALSRRPAPATDRLEEQA